jgi:FlaA1/EpsC-like NDP-sugar epimerase
MPKIVFHAAAYKHVPCMELFPDEAILNNLGATIVLAETAIKANVDKFVQISTDKAVFPSSIMGASKRLCELFIHHVSRDLDHAYISVRFGNVIGSKGSVFTVFEKQIRDGGPVTVTDPDMERFFMSIDEACKLVLEAAAMGEKGQNFILDMGEPIKIIDLARHMITLAGFSPDQDINIEVVGARPGEKVKERLWYPYEEPSRTANPKVFAAQSDNKVTDQFEVYIDEIMRLAEEIDIEKMIKSVQKIIPEYNPMD